MNEQDGLYTNSCKKLIFNWFYHPNNSMKGEEAIVTKTRQLVIKRRGNFDFDLGVFIQEPSNACPQVHSSSTNTESGEYRLFIWLLLALTFLPLQHAPSHQWSTSPPKQRGLSLVPFASLAFSWQNLAPLASESSKRSDGYNKYDSTTVRPNFCWTSFGVSIWKQVDWKIRQDGL